MKIDPIKNPAGRPGPGTSGNTINTANSTPPNHVVKPCALCSAPSIHRRMTTTGNFFSLCNLCSVKMDFMPIGRLLETLKRIDAAEKTARGGK